MFDSHCFVQGGSQLAVVIDCTHINNTDFTAAKGFKAMIADFKNRDQSVYWLNPTQEIQYVLHSVAGDSFSVIHRLEEICRNSSEDGSVQTYQNQDAE